MSFVKINKCLNCGISHSWTFDGMTLKEMREIKKLTGLRVMEFAAAGDDGDPEAIAALVYIMHKRNKISLPFDDVDLDFTDFVIEPTEEEKEAMVKLESGSDPKVIPIKNGQRKKAGSERK